MNGQLGSIQFSGLMGFQTFDDKRAATYAEHPLLDGKSRLQRTGDELEEIQLTFTLHSSFCDPKAQYKVLEAARADGEIMPLVDGSGEYISDFVITELSYMITQTGPFGSWVSVDVAVTLKEYITPDREAAKITDAKSKAFARSENSPRELEFKSVPLEGPVAIETTLRGVSADAVKVDAEITAAQSVSRSAQMLKRATRTIGNIRGGLAVAGKLLDKAQDIYTQTQTLRQNVAMAQTAADRLNASIQEGSLDSTAQYAREFKLSMDGVRKASQSITLINVTRQ